MREKLISTRKGAKGKCQQEMFDALIPILRKYRRRYSRDEFWGFVTGTISILYKHVEEERINPTDRREAGEGV